MPEKEASTIRISCPCCGAELTVDPALAAVLDHKVPERPHAVPDLKEAARHLQDQALRRDEKVQQLREAEKDKAKLLDRKFQELLKKAKEEPLTKPLKDIDLD
ncbi:MAG TPA: hypothetical protein VNL14_05045 [Candidatus Acidoferrales bacterium]|nr:hypothetical protein [Candidatus Acidoferrales bacterium]